MEEKNWIKFRHRIARNLLYATLGTYCRWKYNATIEKYNGAVKGPYLVLYNHQTAYDQFMVGMSIDGPVYYLATEDIFSMGWVSSVIRYLVAPIPIKKQTMDISAVKTCMRVAREGGTLAIAPEGNRTYSGKTEFINPAIASLAKKMKLPILLYRIEGGYGVHPRWSDVIRKGKMRGYVSEVLLPEEYEKWSKEELAERIIQGLYVNEARDDASFYHPKRAEYLERVIYICPDCGLSSFESHGERLTCKKCGKTAIYDATTRLEGVDFSFVSDWYDYQKDYINALDVTALTAEPLYTETVSVQEVFVYRKKQLIKEKASLSLYGNRLVLDGTEYPFAEVAVTILGKNKLNVYAGEKVYQIKGDPRFNALKYIHLYNRCKNIQRGDENEQFLGL